MALQKITERLQAELRKSELHENVADSFMLRLESEGLVSAVDALLRAQNDPQVLARCFANTLDFEIYDSTSDIVEDAGNGWIISNAGILFLRNPFDSALRERLNNRFGSSVQGLGVLPDADDETIKVDEDDEDLSLDDQTNLDHFLDRILIRAIKENTSDVHLRALDDEAHIRIRVDGRLVDIKTIELGESFVRLVNRIFTRAHLDANDFASPKDSGFQFNYKGRSIPIRVASLPTSSNDTIWPHVTLRLLGSSSALRDIEKLGFPNSVHNSQLKMLRSMTRRPNGIILATGPTGHGKTTTLYAMINKMILDAPHQAYYSLEDPIEIRVPSVDQIQINQAAGLTFATGLKHLLRKDPDKILLGEIRDEETMRHALRAGLTGHLVLSTLHSNNAFAAIPRLLEMGANAGNLADTFVGIIAQRIVRKVCQHCSETITWRQMYTLDHPRLQAAAPELQAAYKDAANIFDDLPMAPNDGDQIRIAGDGCGHCRKQGHSGRRIISEVVSVDRRMREMIAFGAPTDDLIRHAQIHRGFVEMWGHALECIVAGEITFESALSVLEERDPLTPRHCSTEAPNNMKLAGSDSGQTSLVPGTESEMPVETH